MISFCVTRIGVWNAGITITFILPHGLIQDDRNVEAGNLNTTKAHDLLCRAGIFSYQNVSNYIIIYRFISVNIYIIFLDKFTFLKYACGWQGVECCLLCSLISDLRESIDVLHILYILSYWSRVCSRVRGLSLRPAKDMPVYLCVIWYLFLLEFLPPSGVRER